jgi:putative ABC transport system substrate-binding protein
MKRRDFSAALAGIAGAIALPVRAQQPRKLWRIGVLFTGERKGWFPYPELLEGRLRDLGYRSGQSINLDFRFDGGRTERLPGLAADLVRGGSDLIVTGYDLETLATMRATASIPIVMLCAVDPLGNRLVASLARPGGNVTGLTYEGGPEVAGKRVEILKEAIPRLMKVGFLFGPDYPGLAPYRRVWKETSQSLGLQYLEFEAQHGNAFAVQVAAMRNARLGALFFGEGQTSVSQEQLQELVDFTVKARIPAMFVVPGRVEMGGLIAYLPSDEGRIQRGAAIIDKILKGARPADIPVEQPIRYELVVNLKTAKAIGFEFPRSILARADRVIE